MAALISAAAAPQKQPTYRPMDRRGFDTLVAMGRPPTGNDPRTVQQTATGLASNLFFAPMLEEMRRLPFGGAVGGGGREEQVFGPQLDQRIADSVAGANAGGLTYWIQQKIEQFGACDRLKGTDAIRSHACTRPGPRELALPQAEVNR